MFTLKIKLKKTETEKMNSIKMRINTFKLQVTLKKKTKYEHWY